MELQTVKETAIRFHISERRVQKLCESGRIMGAQMIDNVWVIPSDAPKPIDQRIIRNNKNLISLNELCKELSISTATGRNWVKLGKLTPSSVIRQMPFFTPEYASDLKSDIATGKNTALKSRRNKKYVFGNNMYHSYIANDSPNSSTVQSLLSAIAEQKLTLTEETICAIIAECALQLILHKNHHANNIPCLPDYLQGRLSPNPYFFLIDDFIGSHLRCDDIIAISTHLPIVEYVYEANEDLLGFLYISLSNIGNRKARGSYYTPTTIVKKMCQHIMEKNPIENGEILDPCCGTGNFILQLPTHISYENVYGNDIDPVSVKIARINFALKYHVTNASVLYEHITENDYLSFTPEKKYDYIIGNPPWGFHFSDSQKEILRSKYQSAAGSSIESYDIFVEQSLSMLKHGGILSFVLPEAILNVKMHTPIREIMLNCSSIQYLELLGNVFDKVQCPCIILQLQYTGQSFNSIGMTVSDASRTYVIQQERAVSAKCLSFSMTDEEYHIIKKMDCLQNKETLQNQSKFALGIVTGNNKKYILTDQKSSAEIILKGSDLYLFKYKPSSNYIVFQPEHFQQTAPTEYYRAPEKLLYRFVCNQLVFAYDDRQTLSLNSCNILIPEINGLHMKYVLAVLNSRMAQFYFMKQFHSVKVLRSHIEQIPLPAIGIQGQEDIIRMVDYILTGTDPYEITKTYNTLDQIIAKHYGLNQTDYQCILTSVEKESLLKV